MGGPGEEPAAGPSFSDGRTGSGFGRRSPVPSARTNAVAGPSRIPAPARRRSPTPATGLALQLGGLEVGDTAAWAARGGEAEAGELESIAEDEELESVAEEPEVGWPWNDPSISEKDKEMYR